MLDSAEGLESPAQTENHVVTRRLNVHIRGNLAGFQKAGQGYRRQPDGRELRVDLPGIN